MTTIAPRRPATPLLRLLLVAAVLVGTVLTVFAGSASAHAALTGSTPREGAVVATAPRDITLSFSEQVSVGTHAIRVLTPDNKRADTGKVVEIAGGARYRVALRSGLIDGTYTVAWQAVSADTHPVGGAFTFSIGAPSTTTATPDTGRTGGGLVGFLYGAARYFSYAGFILLVGGAAFVLVCWPRGAAARPLQRLVVRGWLTFTAATLALLLLRAPYTGSGRIGDVFNLGALQEVLATKEGAALVSRLLLLGASAVFVAVLFGAYGRRGPETAEHPDRPGGEPSHKDLTFGLSIGGVVIAAGLAATWSLSEHASTGIQTALAMPLDVIHLLAAATWLGGLTALLVALYRVPAIGVEAVRRYSRTAFGCVVVLVVSGLYQAWRQLGSWSALGGTAYGQLLMIKVGLVVGMVVLAYFSRRWTARLAEDAPADDVETAADAEPAPTTVAVAAAPARSDERGAQLARQHAAVANAREKKARNAGGPGRRGLRRSVLAEAAVAVAVLAVAAVLSDTEPGRTVEATHAPTAPAANGTGYTLPGTPIDVELPFDTGGPKGRGTAEFYLDPARTGALNVIHVYVQGSNGQPLEVPEVRASITLAAKDLGPLSIRLQHLTTAHWAADKVQIPTSGTWQLALTVRTSAIDEVTVHKNIRIG